MAYRCPHCGRPELEQQARWELPADSRSDEIALQTLRCRACGLRAVAVYEESRRGALDSESWELTGYRVAPETFVRLAAAIAACPRPDDRRCDCPSHREWGACVDGRWSGLRLLEPASCFELR